MNQQNMTLAIASIAAALAMTAVAFAAPQLVFAHYGHHSSHNSNSVRVDQNTTQVNLCDSSLCVNQADNTAHIQR